MKRAYIYVIVILLTISLVTADYIIGKDLNKIIPLDDTYRTVDNTNVVKESTVVTTLTIKNEQNTDNEITYKYTLKINDLSGAYRYKYNDKEGYIVFTANGETNFELKSNESIIIYDVPVDLDYTVKQETTNDKYTIKVGQNETNTYSAKVAGEDSVTFNNSTKVDTKKENKKENKEQKQEKEKETKKTDKKDIPNTGSREIKMTAFALLSLLIVYCIKKLKVKRFE